MTACNPAPRTRLAVLALIAALPAACAAPRPPNPFVGAWATPERQQIAFRADTVVLNPPGEPPTPMSVQTCDGKFSFVYTRATRDSLLAQTPRQPALRRQLEAQLLRPDYEVANVSCGDGGTTYVLLDDKNVLAIHRDQDIAGVERLTRI